MADEADIANDYMAKELDAAIAAARGEITPGVAGECDECGETYPRLVNGLCAGCREDPRVIKLYGLN